jgi:hypothetical protein
LSAWAGGAWRTSRSVFLLGAWVGFQGTGKNGRRRWIVQTIASIFGCCFMLCFVSGGARLTPASEWKFAEILSRWRIREKQPLVPTPDEAPEPRNRRVQITSAECPLAHRPARCTGLQPGSMYLFYRSNPHGLARASCGGPASGCDRCSVRVGKAISAPCLSTMRPIAISTSCLTSWNFTHSRVLVKP